MNIHNKKVDDIYTYMKFRGDLDLKNHPLNEVDALIFSELSYIQFENIVPRCSVNTFIISKITPTIVKISDEELPLVTLQLFGKNVACANAYDLIAQNYPKIKLILITQGEMGSTCYDCQNKKIYTCKAEPVTAVSTVGAGDSYGATFLTQYLKANDIMLSMALASKVSAFVVSHQEAIPNDTKEFIKSVVPT